MITFNCIIAVLNVLGAALLIRNIFIKDKMPRWISKTYHALIAIAAAGLIAQTGRCLQFVFTGESPTDNDLPLWVLKDLSIVGLAILVTACVALKNRGYRI